MPPHQSDPSLHPETGMDAKHEMISSPPLSGADNYELGDEIARGGVGSVLEAQDSKLKRTVAVKIMMQDADANEMMRHRFVREAEILAALAHPNIVPIYDIVWEDGLPLLYSMKRVQGETLQSILGAIRKEEPEVRDQFPLSRLLAIFRKVCDAIEFAHSKGILHRDLKPENIMIGEFGEVLVMDWGIAKILRNNETELLESWIDSGDPQGDALPNQQSGIGATLQGAVMGTPQYMSPEQALGRVDDLDEQSDVYALGAILYAILTLRPPVDGATAQEILGKVSNGQITALAPSTTQSRTTKSSSRPGKEVEARQIKPLPHLPAGRIPKALSSVTMHALQLEKASRYLKVSEINAEIEAYQGGFATSHQKSSSLKQLTLLVMRHKAICAAVALILTFSVIFIFKLMESEQAAKMSAEESRRSLATSHIALAQASFGRGDLAGMIGVLKKVPADLQNHDWRYFSRKLDSSLGPLTVAGFTGPTQVCAVPNQAAQFAIARNDGKIGFVDARSKTLLRTIDTKTPGKVCFCFSGDGHRMLTLTFGTPMARLFDVESGKEVNSFQVQKDDGKYVDYLLHIALSEDGKMAALVNSQRGQLQLIDTKSGKVKWQREGSQGRMIFHPNAERLIVVAPLKRKVEILDTSDGRPIMTKSVYCTTMALSPDTKTIAVGLFTGELLMLDSTTGKELRRAQLHTSAIAMVSWTAGGNLLTLGGDGRFEGESKSIRLWYPQTLAPRGRFFGLKSTNPFLEASLNVESGHLLTNQQPPQLWRIPDEALYIGYDLSSEQGWSCNFLSDEILLARQAFELIRYDVSNPRKPSKLGSALADWHAMSAAAPAASLFAIGKPFASGSEQIPPTIRLMHQTSDGITEKWNQPAADIVRHMDFDAAAKRLLIVEYPEAIRVLDVQNGMTLANFPMTVERAFFAGTKERIVAFQRRRDKTVESIDRILLIDSQSGTILKSLERAARLNALAVSPDRQLIAIAGDDQTVTLLDAGTLDQKHQFHAHDAAITALCFHPTKPILATGSMDFSIKLWDYTKAQSKQAILGLNGRPISITFSPSGHLLATDGMDSAFRIYQVDLQEPLRE